MPDFLGRGVLWPTDPVPGFIGTGSAARVAVDTAPIFYVDSGHVLANDDNDGTDPDAPLATIQAIIDRTTALAAGTGTRQPVLAEHSIIYVSGTVSESVVTGSNANMPFFISIIGVGNSMNSPIWSSPSDTLPALDVRSQGVMVSGFRFAGKTSAPTIALRFTDTGANDYADYAIVKNCKFFGGTNDLYAIQTWGARYVTISENIFWRFHVAAGTAACLFGDTFPVNVPSENRILRNLFLNSDNGVIWPCTESLVEGNKFLPVGANHTMTQILNTATVAAGGDNNMVTGNVLPGDYSIAGGYRGGAADVWVGNFADDVAEAEVGDNGITLAVPT